MEYSSKLIGVLIVSQQYCIKVSELFIILDKKRFVKTEIEKNIVSINVSEKCPTKSAAKVLIIRSHILTT